MFASAKNPSGVWWSVMRTSSSWEDKFSCAAWSITEFSPNFSGIVRLNCKTWVKRDSAAFAWVHSRQRRTAYWTLAFAEEVVDLCILIVWESGLSIEWFWAKNKKWQHTTWTFFTVRSVRPVCQNTFVLKDISTNFSPFSLNPKVSYFLKKYAPQIPFASLLPSALVTNKHSPLDEAIPVMSPWVRAPSVDSMPSLRLQRMERLCWRMIWRSLVPWLSFEGISEDWRRWFLSKIISSSNLRSAIDCISISIM